MKSKGQVTTDKDGNFLLTGMWIYWYENGQKKAEGIFDNARDSGDNASVLSDPADPNALSVPGRDGKWIFLALEWPKGWGGKLQGRQAGWTLQRVVR